MEMRIEISKQFPLRIYDVRNIGIRWLNVLKKYEKLILADFYRTVDTWEEQPTFESEVRFSGSNPRLFVWTDDDIYTTLDEGTDIRYDVMTSDPLYRPKTKVGVLRSFPGEGEFAYRDPFNPRPGIDARRFAFTVTNKYEKLIQKELQEAAVEGLKVRKGL